MIHRQWAECAVAAGGLSGKGPVTLPNISRWRRQTVVLPADRSGGRTTRRAAGRIAGMFPVMDIALDDLRLRTLDARDVGLVVEATRGESGRALWDAHPVGPYSWEDARAALRAWDGSSGQVSFGVLEGSRPVAAVGLMSGGADVAELAYWVRPEERHRGIGLRSVRAVTRWAREDAGLRRVWLEIDPDNEASLRLARAAGYRFEERLPHHCRCWVDEVPERDLWHDCLIWVHGRC